MNEDSDPTLSFLTLQFNFRVRIWIFLAGMSSYLKLVHMILWLFAGAYYDIRRSIFFRYADTTMLSFPSYFQACVCIRKVDLKDNRNIYLKGSSARTLTNFNSQKAFRLFVTFIIFSHELKPSQTPQALSCKLRILLSFYLKV